MFASAAAICRLEMLSKFPLSFNTFHYVLIGATILKS